MCLHNMGPASVCRYTDGDSISHRTSAAAGPWQIASGDR